MHRARAGQQEREAGPGAALLCAVCRCRSSETHLLEPPLILPLLRTSCASKRGSSLFLFLIFARASAWNQTFCSRMWAWQVASPRASLFPVSVGERQPLCAALGRPGGQRRLAPWEGSVCSGGFQPSFLDRPRSGGLGGSCRRVGCMCGRDWCTPAVVAVRG